MINVKLVFRAFKGRYHDNQSLLVLVHGCRWTHMASGAAGRANVGLCPASSSRKVRSTRYWSKCGPIKTGIVTYCARDGRRDSRHADYSSVVDCHDTMHLTENNATRFNRRKERVNTISVISHFTKKSTSASSAIASVI